MAVTPQLFHPMSGTARVSAVHQQLAEQDVFLQEIRDRLEQSQQYYKSFNDKKHYIEDMYPEYLTEMTQPNLIGIGTGPHSNKMAVEYPLEIESYSDKIKSCN